MRRWHKRLARSARAAGYTATDQIDLAFTFFQNCFHLREWVLETSDIPAHDVATFMARPEMKVCRDLANGTKHLNLKRKPSVDADLSIGREYDPRSPHGHRLFVIAGEDKYDLLDLARECLASWEDFLADGNVVARAQKAAGAAVGEVKAMDPEQEAVFSAANLLAASIQRVAREVIASTTSPKRRAEGMGQLRKMIRAERGIPESSKRKHETVLGRNLQRWIRQSREEQRDGAWLKRACMAVDGRFTAVPLPAFDVAIKPPNRTRGPLPTLQPAVDLAKAAGITIHKRTLQNLEVDVED